VQKFCPHLVSEGLIKPEDFKMLGKKEAAKMFRIERKAGKRGFTQIEGAGITLGKKFEGKKVVKLSEDTWGIVDTVMENEEITHVFQPPTQEEIAKRREKVKEKLEKAQKTYTPSQVTARTRFKKDEIEILPYHPTRRNPKFADETPEEYAERIRNIKGFNILNKLSKDLSQKAGMGIHNLSLKEQEWLTSAAPIIQENYDQFIEFAKTYGLEGIKTFLSCEFDKEMASKILTLGKTAETDAARAVFDKYSQIVDQTEGVRDYLRANFGEEKEFSEQTVNQIINTLLKRGRDLLADFADKAKKQKGKIDTSQIMKELAEIQTENILFLSIFRELKKSGEKIDFEDIKDIEFNIEKAAELEKEDIKQMKDVYARNYQQYPDLQKELLADFDKAIENEKSTFYTLKHKGKVVAFNRFDDLGKGKKRFASFNVDPGFKGAKLGEAMMERSVDLESQNNVLEATCLSFTPISGKYIETGFAAQELIDYKGLPVLKIEKDNKKESEYAFKGKSKQEIINLFEREYKGKELTGAEKVVIKRVKPDQSGKNFEILNQGYVLTRYFREKGGAYLVFEKEKQEKPAKAA
jgi:N-acetylglutamate synthase-like GNAT family acetyltransferase